MTPARVQLRRTKGYRKPPGAVVVTRATRWGNPFRVGHVAIDIGNGDHSPTRIPWKDRHRANLSTSRPLVEVADAATAVAMFRRWAHRRHTLAGDTSVPYVDAARDALAGRDLACYCPLDGPCHADVLIELANGPLVRTSPVGCGP